jgi:WD40 repeat protein
MAVASMLPWKLVAAFVCFVSHGFFEVDGGAGHSRSGFAAPPLPQAGAGKGGSPLDQLVLQDVTTPQERQELSNEAVVVIRGEGKGAAYQVAAFSSDDKRLALGTNGGAVELWGLDGGQPKRLAVLRPAAKAGPVFKLALSKDGKWMASIHGSVGGFLALWRLDNDGGSLVGTLKMPPRMDEVTFHPGGKVLVCSSPRNGQDLPIVAKCYAVSDKGLEPLNGEFEGAVQRFTFTPDRRFAAIYFTPERNGPLYGSEVVFWTFSEQTQDVAVHQRIRLENGIRAIAFTRDGKWLATGSLDNKVRLWDLTNNPPSVAKMFDVPIWARDLAFTAKDSHLVVFSGGMNILVWNVAAGRIEHQWDLKNAPKAKLGAGAISASAMASDGRHILYSRVVGAAVILRLPIR